MNAALTFLRYRWGYRFPSRAALHRHQQRRLRALLAGPVQATRGGCGLSPQTPLPQLPTTTSRHLKLDPGEWLAAPIDVDAALGVALRAEATRDFQPEIDGITVGVSSGTSGRRSLFAVSPAERREWAAIVLARLLPGKILRQILTPWQPPVRLAFILRASGNLYETVASPRLTFQFIDLLQPYGNVLRETAAMKPDVIVAPTSVLEALASAARAGEARLTPQLVVAVAEPCDEESLRMLQEAFSCEVRQVYQATAGLLGVTCEAGELHLLEEHCIVEPRWLDAERTRFHPLVTDLARTTQVSLRRELDDVLRTAPDGGLGRCRCGRRTRRLSAIDGRGDDVLRGMSAHGGDAVLFPDVLRRAFVVHGHRIADWRIRAHDDGGWEIAVVPIGTAPRAEAEEDALAALEEACLQVDMVMPPVSFTAWQKPPPGAKRRRIVQAGRERPA